MTRPRRHKLRALPGAVPFLSVLVLRGFRARVPQTPTSTARSTDAASKKTLDVFDPATEAVMADGAVRRQAAMSSLRSGGRRRRLLRRPGSRARRKHPRPDALSIGRPCAGPGRRKWPRPETPQSPASRSSKSKFHMDDTATCFEYYGGLATKINGEVPQRTGAGNSLINGAARAARRRRLHHAVELSADDGGLEGRAGDWRPATRSC